MFQIHPRLHSVDQSSRYSPTSYFENGVAEFLEQHAKVRRVHYPFLRSHPQYAGGVESLVSLPVLTSHAMISAEQRAAMGVTEQMVRLPVGIESVEDQIENPERALEAVSSRVGVPVGSSSRS
jgi:cystathionine beta-lyase/cystathionine gamma-synthase